MYADERLENHAGNQSLKELSLSLLRGGATNL